MGRFTKEHERALFIAEFLRRLREAAHGERIYMRVGDMFRDAMSATLTSGKPRGAKTAAALTTANRLGVSDISPMHAQVKARV